MTQSGSSSGPSGNGGQPPPEPDIPPPPKMEEAVPEMSWRELAIEDYVTLFLFWVLASVVFAQFFTRYVMNSPLAWTEEIARYLLIYVGFLGSVLAVRKNSHIFIEVFYHFLPNRLSKALLAIVDVIRTTFFLVATMLSWQVTGLMSNQYMSVVPYPMSIIYAVVTAAFALMAFRSIQVSWRNWHEGYAMIDRLRPPEGKS